MQGKFIFLVTVIICFALLGGLIYFFLQNNDLKLNGIESKNTMGAMEKEISRLSQEKKKLAKELDGLQENAIIITKSSTQLQDDKKTLEAQLTETQGLVEQKIAEMQEVNEQLKVLKKKFDQDSFQLTGKKESLVQENEALKGKVQEMTVTLRREKALYYYNLGVAYARAQLFEDAIASYQKSLALNSSNPEAHYNLGLLYDSLKRDPEVAALHYQKYLEFAPQADDREEVMMRISGLLTKIFE